MGFVDALRMRNLYPSTGIGPPNMTGGFDILNSLNLQQQPAAPAVPEFEDYFTRRAKENALRRDNMATQLAEHQGRSTLSPTPRYSGNIQFIQDPRETHERQKELLGIKSQPQLEKIAQANALGQAKLEQAGELGNRRLDIQQQRADVYDFKTKHPNMVIKAPAGGNYTLFDPQTGEAVDSGIATGTMSQEDFQKLVGSQRIEQIQTQGNVQRLNQGARHNQTLQQIGARIKGQQDLQSSKPQNAMLPSQQKVGLANQANQIINTDPELGQFISMNTDGTFTITPPGRGGPSLDQYSRLQEKLYPKSPTTGGNTSYNNANAPTAPAGWKYVPKVGGGWTAVEDKGGK